MQGSGLEREERAEVMGDSFFAVGVLRGCIEWCQHDEKRGSCSTGRAAEARVRRMLRKVSKSSEGKLA